MDEIDTVCQLDPLFDTFLHHSSIEDSQELPKSDFLPPYQKEPHIDVETVKDTEDDEKHEETTDIKEKDSPKEKMDLQEDWTDQVEVTFTSADIRYKKEEPTEGKDSRKDLRLKLEKRHNLSPTKEFLPTPSSKNPVFPPREDASPEADRNNAAARRLLNANAQISNQLKEEKNEVHVQKRKATQTRLKEQLNNTLQPRRTGNGFNPMEGLSYNLNSPYPTSPPSYIGNHWGSYKQEFDVQSLYNADIRKELEKRIHDIIDEELYILLESKKEFTNMLYRLSIRLDLLSHEVVDLYRSKNEILRNVIPSQSSNTNYLVQNVTSYIRLRQVEAVRTIQATLEASLKLLKENFEFKRYSEYVISETKIIIEKLWFLLNFDRYLDPETFNWK